MAKIQEERKEKCCQTAVKNLKKIRRKEKLLGCINNCINPLICKVLTALIHYDTRCYVL